MSPSGHDGPRTAALTFRAASFGYGRWPVLEAIDGSVSKGACLAILGPNGAGKSTLLKGIVGEAPLLAGAVDRHGRRPADIAFLPQGAAIDRAFPISVGDFVATGAWRRLGPFRPAGRAVRAAVGAALERVGLAGLAARPIGELSGGQLQRALFARTVVQDAHLILLDEPFAAVDERTTTDLLAVVCGWKDEGRTVLAALHDEGQARSVFPDALLLARTVIGWGPTAAVLAPETLAQARAAARAWSARAETSAAA